MPWPWEQSASEPYPDIFPGYELVDEGEAQILVGKAGVLKVYKPEYTPEVVKHYSEVTNSLARSTRGQVISVDLANGLGAQFNLIVNSVTEIGNIPNGRSYTKGKFIGGPHLEELDHLVHQMGLSANRIQQLLLSERGVPYLIRDLVEHALKRNLSEDDHLAVRMHPRNMKLTDDGRDMSIIVTDISCRISDLIGTV